MKGRLGGAMGGGDGRKATGKGRRGGGQQGGEDGEGAMERWRRVEIGQWGGGDGEDVIGKGGGKR